MNEHRRIDLKTKNAGGDGGQEPTVEPNTPDPNDRITQKQFEVFVGRIDTIEKTMAQLEETLKNAETPEERKAAIEKQLEDAKAINKRNKAVIPIHGQETFDSDFLFKGITETTPKDVAMGIVKTTWFSPTESEVIKTWQNKLTELKILSECLDCKPHDLEMWKSYEQFLEDTGIDKIVNLAGAPTNFIPEGWSDDLLQYFYQELEIAMMFADFTMPQNPYDWKIIGRPKAVRYIEQTSSQGTRGTDDPTYQDPPQGNIRFDAKVMMVPTLITEEFKEDALMDYMPTLTQETIPMALAQALESTIINGHTDTTNPQDDGTTNADVESCFDGVRRIALERSATIDASTYNFGVFSKVARKGGIYTVKPRDGAWIMSNSAYTQCLDFDQVKTLDVTNMPTNTQGAVNMVLGRPVYVSAEYPENLDSTGVVSGTAANNTKTGFTHVNRRQFRIGNVREETVAMEYDIRLQSWVIVATCRKDFQAMENRRTGYTPAVSGRNITSQP